MAIDTIHEFYTDGIATQGSVRRISFHLLADIRQPDGVTVTREWHYYGTTAPGPTLGGVPTVQHTDIQMPADLSRLPTEEAADLLYEFGQRVARREL
jgi:hypothetical protein